MNDEWLGEELVYDRSRFLEKHEAPSMARGDGFEAVVLLRSRNMRLISDQQIADRRSHHVVHRWHWSDQHFVQTPDAISSVHQRGKEQY